MTPGGWQLRGGGEPAPTVLHAMAAPGDNAEPLRHGLTNEEIARELSLSALTVRNPLSLVYERCGVGGRVELMSLMERPPAPPAPTAAPGK